MMTKTDNSGGYFYLVNRWLTNMVNQWLTVNQLSFDLGTEKEKNAKKEPKSYILPGGV